MRSHLKTKNRKEISCHWINVRNFSFLAISNFFDSLNVSLIYFLIEAGEHSFPVLIDFLFRLIFRFMLTLTFVWKFKILGYLRNLKTATDFPPHLSVATIHRRLIYHESLSQLLWTMYYTSGKILCSRILTPLTILYLILINHLVSHSPFSGLSMNLV